MNEVKMPKRPILAYYILIFLAIFLFNSIFVPMLRENAMNDPELVERLHKSGADFTGEIVEAMNPLLSALLYWVLPILIFFGIGHYMNKRLMKNMGGPGAMQFGMGKSNAKIFVKPTNGIKFSDVAGEDEAKDSLQEVVEYLHDPTKYRDIGAKMPKGILLVGPPGTRPLQAGEGKSAVHCLHR